MVSGLSILFMTVSLLISILFPLGLAIYFYKKEKVSIAAIFFGALTFAVFQWFTRIPLLSYLQTKEWFISFSSNLALFWIFLGLTAGLFEELGRFIVYKLLMKNKLSRSNSIAFGIGHGGIEALLLLGLPMLNYIILSITINSGVFESQIADKLPLMAAIQVKDILINTAPYMFSIGAVERIFAITIQIALSILVMYGVKSGKFRYVVYAIIAHTVIDSPLGLLAHMGVGTIGIEVYVAICAAIALVYILKSKKSFKELEPAQVEAPVEEQQLSQS